LIEEFRSRKGRRNTQRFEEKEIACHIRKPSVKSTNAATVTAKLLPPPVADATSDKQGPKKKKSEVVSNAMFTSNRKNKNKTVMKKQWLKNEMERNESEGKTKEYNVEFHMHLTYHCYQATVSSSLITWNRMLCYDNAIGAEAIVGLA
jgi:hypothetical protein